MVRPVATGKAAARARQGAGLPPAAVAGAAGASRPALAGLCAVAMALPLAVLGPASRVPGLADIADTLAA